MDGILLAPDRAQVKDKLRVISNACLEIEMVLDGYAENTFDDNEYMKTQAERILYEALDMADIIGYTDNLVIDLLGDDIYE